METNIRLMTYNEHIEKVLGMWKTEIGEDYDRYYAHVYRVFNYAGYLLGFHPQILPQLAIASAFHDIGIWTSDTFDYLKPSIAEAKKYMRQTNQEILIEETCIMIEMHHKITIYKGPYPTTVEAFRCADWTDVTFGNSNWGISKEIVNKVTEAFPYDGFHWMMLKKGVLHGLKNPFKPLPMMRK